MPGYQRFVTYLFRYEEEKKLENCGFAKVEIRQDQCRIQLQVKGIRQKSMEVYLLNQNVTEPKGVLLGSMQPQNGVAQQIFFCNSNHVGESGYAIGQMRGIYIPLEQEEFVASQWDDEVTVWGRFQPWRSKEDVVSNADSSKIMEVVEETRSSDANMDVGTIVRGNERSSSSETKRIEKRMVHQDSKTAEMEKGELRQNSQTAEMKKREMYQDSETEEKNRMIQKLEESREEIDGELHATQTSAVMTHPVQMSWAQQWERFTAAHPLICPFDEDDHVYAVKLRLQDFTILPKRYQYLANNNFLLHGYFNYEMILFGYMEEEKRRWFLGVPGVFSNQEQLLAGIFGFPEFRTKQVTRQKTGEYGYWCRYL